MQLINNILRRQLLRQTVIIGLLYVCNVVVLAATSSILLTNSVRVDSEGVFLDQLMSPSAQIQWPRIRLFDAPAWGQITTLNRNQIQTTLRGFAPELADKIGSGNDKVQITRRSRQLKEAEIVQMLTDVLQRDNVRNQGILELRLTRTWHPILVPDEVLEIKIGELPLSGVTPNFIIRFELRTAKEALGTLQYPVQARIWQEVFVAANYLRRGQLLGLQDVTKQRRDVLTLNDPMVIMPAEEASMELVDNLPAGTPISQRSLRARPLIHRGDLVVAKIEEGPLCITLKVEALEEGAYGQAIRVRNPQTRKELRGKVYNEQTVLLAL
jgi:flagella basal body P-ring formation protein FlgA